MWPPLMYENYALTQRVRTLLREKGGYPQHLTQAQLGEVLRRVDGDADLAATAIRMWPRPGWLGEIIPGDRGALPFHKDDAA